MDDEISDEARAKCEEAGIAVYTLNGLVKVGREQAAAGSTSIAEPATDDCFMFSYTSGTTGDPKGVKLSQRMIIQCAQAL